MNEYGDLGGAVVGLLLIALVLVWAHFPRRKKNDKRPFDWECD